MLQDQCKAVLPYKHKQKSGVSGTGTFGHTVIDANSKIHTFLPNCLITKGENIKYTVQKMDGILTK